MQASKERFLALDSLRGICACAVVLYHFGTTGMITNLPLFRNGWLFVDFFFVLSGFVITAGYGDRLAGGFSIVRFMFLRLGRIYPLHIAMIVAFLLLELAGWWIGTGGLSARAPFTESRSLQSLPTNLLLLQIFGIHDQLTWNGPSWSIAAEIWAYLLFAFGIRFGKGLFPFIVILTVVFSGIVLASVGTAYLDRTFTFSLVRCLYGFGLGILAWRIYATRLRGRAWTPATSTMVEIVCVALCLSLVWVAHAGPLTLACPPMFFLVTLVFARQRGAVSRILLARPLLFLGTVSYSIYMVHIFVEGRVIDVLTIIGNRFGMELASIGRVNGEASKIVTAPWPLADLVTLGMLALVIGCAWISYRLVELPFRTRSREFVARWPGGDRTRATITA